jgi:hypothetical protein
VRGGNLHDVVAFLVERLRHGPGSVGRDVQQDDPDAKILHLGDDLREILFGTDDDGVGHRIVPGQRGQVTVNLGFDAFAVPGPHPAQAQFQPGQLSQRVVLGCPAALDGSLIPVTPKQRQAGAVPRNSGQ